MSNEINLIVNETNVGLRLDQFISQSNSDLSRSYIQKLIKDNLVTLNNKIVSKPRLEVKLNDSISISLPEPEPLEIIAQDIPLDILYEDDDILVVNKPKGMVVHPAPGHYTDTLVNAIMYHCKNQLSGINGILRPGIVHRIDKDTTGALVVCKNDHSHKVLSEQLKEHSLTRTYQAIVQNNFKEDEGTIDLPIGRHPIDRKKRTVTEHNSKRAVTHYKVLDHLNNKFNLIECKLETGRTHQIRVHMAHIGHPILGDTIYGSSQQAVKNLQGQTLHARTLGFIHPTTAEYIEFVAPLPAYFENLIKKLS